MEREQVERFNKILDNTSNAHMKVQLDKKSPRQCCSALKHKEKSIVHKGWDFRKDFKRIDLTMQNKNELFNKESISGFIETCFKNKRNSNTLLNTDN
jgi:hypothetical protein